jgi:phosphonoacetaldehyde hydrolase
VKRLQLVIFDWAGTTVDHGCFAPVAAFVQAFARHGVTVTSAEARGPMGLHKKDHIRALLRIPDVARRWRKAHGDDADESDVDRLYRDFMPLQLDVIAAHGRLVSGLLDCVAWLRDRGLQIGTTTGYFREAADQVYTAARSQGYVSDHDLCAEEVPAGRPAPWMIFRIMEKLGTYPPALVVKVGDTVPDIEEGRNAGVWSVGVTRTSSEVGCREDEFAALPAAEQCAKLVAARRKLEDAGAHAIVESVADLPDLLPDLEARLQRGERP